MISVFLDETGDAKVKDYFGLCLAIINSSFYPALKREFQDILTNHGWDPRVEFKGSSLFSASRGDTSISVENRVAIAQELISLNKSEVNARMKFHYFSKHSADHKTDYLNYLPVLLEKALPPTEKRGGKKLVAFHYDQRSDISLADVRQVVLPVLTKRGFALYEDVCMTVSGFETVGVLYADIVGYLSARIQTISSDKDLFENISPEQWETNGKLRKLRSSTKILEGIKQLKLYRVKG